MLDDHYKLSRSFKWINVIYFNVYICITGHMHIIGIVIGTDLTWVTVR